MNNLLLIIFALAFIGLALFVLAQLFICYLEKEYNKTIEDED